MATTFIERGIALIKKVGDDNVLFKPYTSIDMVEGGVASVNEVTPDGDGNVDLDVYFRSEVYTKDEVDDRVEDIVSESTSAIPDSAIEGLFKS